MIAIEKSRSKRVLLSLFVFCLSVFILGIAIPAQAHDGSDAFTWEVDDFSSQQTDHVDGCDATGCYKGWFTLTATNKTDSDWLDFHFDLVDIGGGANTIFTLGGTPWSTAPNYTWTISADQRSLDFYFDAVSSGSGATFQVYTDNTTDKTNFGVLYYPTTTGGTGINGVLPEPVSSTLFIIGGATLGFRRFWKNRKGV